MTYSTDALVKRWIDWESTDDDTFIGELRDDAYADINGMLRKYASVPFGGTENDYDSIVGAEAMMAAGCFLMSREELKDRSDPQKGKMLYEKGIAKVKRYIEDHYLTGDTASSMLKHKRSSHSWDQDLTD